jgi:membrane protein YqaA with SNARE-associated domain
VDWRENLALYGGTFVWCLVGGFIPVVNAEVYLASIAALAGRAAVAPLAVTATAGQMTAKTMIFLAGRGLVHLPSARESQRIQRVLARARAWRGPIELFVFVSAVFGIPPFYIVSALGGALELSVARFIVVGCIGRLIRFLVIAGGANAIAG